MYYDVRQAFGIPTSFYLFMNSIQGQRTAAFLNLARIRIAFMVVISCGVGFVLAYQGTFDIVRFICASIGTGLLSSGSCTINCYIERDLDALMPRTAGRPIPAGIVSPGLALSYGIGLIVVGTILLMTVNLLSTVLGLAAVAIYLGMYTPAKQWTWLNTSIGAIPGAIPPLIGWAAASGTIGLGGWILFALMFIWQHTHFLPIAWMFKDEYRAAGFKMLPSIENGGEKTFALTIITAILLLPLSAMLYWSGNPFVGPAYCFASFLGAIALIFSSARWRINRSREGARTVLLLSLLYLPVLLVGAVIDRLWRWT
ncbi:MAG TPA: heme o synthase [Oculatellaceae cyanobacterium]